MLCWTARPCWGEAVRGNGSVVDGMPVVRIPLACSGSRLVVLGGLSKMGLEPLRWTAFQGGLLLQIQRRADR